VAFVFLSPIAIAGCTEQDHAAAAYGVIVGQVKLGPIMPVCREGVPCDGVYKGAKVVVRARDGAVASRATADDNGEFSADVPAGTYTVAIDVQGPLPSCSSAEATVAARSKARVAIDCDSGIR
jgi:hypothetical protein